MSQPHGILRPLLPSDEAFLREILYHAIYVPRGGTPPPRDIVQRPEMAKYVHGWGRPDDLGFAAVDAVDRHPIGAAWLRLFCSDDPGFGYVDDTTPELSIAVLPESRGRGVGTRLLRQLLEAAQARFRSISLSVAPENPALRLYQRHGFQVVGASGASLTMRKLW